MVGFSPWNPKVESSIPGSDKLHMRSVYHGYMIGPTSELASLGTSNSGCCLKLMSSCDALIIQECGFISFICSLAEIASSVPSYSHPRV